MSANLNVRQYGIFNREILIPQNSSVLYYQTRNKQSLLPHVLKAKGRFLIDDHETIRNKIPLSNISLSLLTREILIPRILVFYSTKNETNRT